MITLQGFINFMKLMDIAQSRDEASNAQEAMKEIDGFTGFQDTMYLMNGMNYAQFLEAILRIAYWKKDNNPDHANSHDGFKNTLETMFADAELDLRKRQKADDAVNELVDLANQGFWKDNFSLLGAIFNDKGIQRNIDHFELSKNDFVALMKDAGCIIKPKAADKEEEKKGDDKKKNADAAKEVV